MPSKPTNYHLAEAVETLAETTRASKYSEDDKIQAVMGFFLTQSSKKAESLSGIPAATIRYWKQNAPWWDTVLVLVKKQKQAELEGKLTNMADTLVDGIASRLTTGDMKLNKHGELVNVPVSAKDQASILKITHDIRQLIRGEPTSRSEASGSKDLENKLIAAVKKAKQENSIEGEVVKDEN